MRAGGASRPPLRRRLVPAAALVPVALAQLIAWTGDDDARSVARQALVALMPVVVVAALWWSRRDRSVAEQGAADRNAAILASTGDAVLVVNPGGSIESVNAAGCALLGYAPGELDRRDLSTVLHPGQGTDDFPERVGFSDGRPSRAFLPEQAVRHRDGSVMPVDIAIGVMPMPDGDHLVLSLRDASQRLEQERAKDALISNVAHELRTPLMSLVGSLALLRAGGGEDRPAPERRLIDIADNNARRLIRLVEDLLDIDRIGSGQWEVLRTPIDLRIIVAQATLDGEGLARTHGVTLHDDAAPAPVMVAGDAGRLSQVLANLVSNAVQASAAGDTVTLRARIANGRAIVSVEDRGPGIPQALRPRLFHRFQSQRSSGGTGLGLAIAREIVGRLDGTIWFEDRTGGGTRFVFDLPLIGCRPC